MNDIHIRRVERHDLHGCFALEQLCYEPIEVAPQDFLEKRIEIYPDGFFVAVYKGEIVGMINSGATHKGDITDEELKYLVGHVRNGRNCVIFSLAVHPDHRGRGIARMLLRKMIDISTQKEKQKILLLCQECLIRFYTSLGFLYAGRSTSSFGGYIMHQMQYELPQTGWMAKDRHNSASLALQ